MENEMVEAAGIELNKKVFIYKIFKMIKILMLPPKIPSLFLAEIFSDSVRSNN